MTDLKMLKGLSAVAQCVLIESKGMAYATTGEVCGTPVAFICYLKHEAYTGLTSFSEAGARIQVCVDRRTNPTPHRTLVHELTHVVDAHRCPPRKAAEQADPKSEKWRYSYMGRTTEYNAFFMGGLLTATEQGGSFQDWVQALKSYLTTGWDRWSYLPVKYQRSMLRRLYRAYSVYKITNFE